MTVKQLSVFVENRAGRLSAVTRLLGDSGIDIRAVGIADTKDFGILRLIVNDPDKALAALRKAGCSVTCTNVLAICISDKPGGLAAAMETLYKDNISVEYMYSATISKEDGTAYLILRVDDNDSAARALTEGGFRVIPQQELAKL